MKRSFSITDLCLPLAIAAGLFIIFNTLDIQGYLSTGDHGRDLYAFERTLHGDVAYRDYWWVYGPLMPLYYALNMKLWGISVISVLLGKALIKFAAGMFIFWGITRIASPVAGLFAALWFYLFSQDFFYTYNHIGGILAITIIAAMLIAYIKNRSFAWLWTALFSAFCLSFVKLNFGLAGLAICATGVFITDSVKGLPASPDKKFFYRTALIYAPLAVAGVYLYLLQGMTNYEIRQCMPYASADHPYNTLPWIALKDFWGLFTKKFFTSTLDFFFGCIVIGSLTRITWLAWKNLLTKKSDRDQLLALLIIGIYFILNFHEYLRSGTWYSSLWSQPLAFMFFFIMIALALRRSGRIIPVIIWGGILALCFMGWRAQGGAIAQIRVTDQYLAHAKVKAFLINKTPWIKAVEETAAFMDRTLKPDEQFFALPYDPLYYYLAGRKSPVQLLIYFEHINIPAEQETRIIAALNTQKINWVVVSNRMRTSERGLGTLGQTYCPLIGKYLNDNFTPVAQFGDWQNDAGWGWNHGTMILKRKAAVQTN